MDLTESLLRFLYSVVRDQHSSHLPHLIHLLYLLRLSRWACLIIYVHLQNELPSLLYEEGRWFRDMEFQASRLPTWLFRGLVTILIFGIVLRGGR